MARHASRWASSRPRNGRSAVRSLCLRLLLLSVAGAGASLPAAAQEPEKTIYERYTEPIEIYRTGLGTFTRPISSTNSEAQAFFNQGFQMMYAFAKPEAVRSFRESWKRDADCAICYWGEAWAWGSYLNAPMTPRRRRMRTRRSRRRARLAAHASPKERALIDAMAVRYVEQFDPNTRVEQDRAYAEAMRKLADKYSDDLDIVTLYADALFLLEPRRGTRDVNDPNVQRLHQVLESVLARDVHHPGRLPPVRSRDRIDRRARASRSLRGVSRQLHPRRQPHQPHAVAHLERGRALGRFGARQSRGVAFGSEGGDRRRLRHLPGAQPAHAALCGVDGRPGRDRDAGRQGLREADRRQSSTRC